ARRRTRGPGRTIGRGLTQIRAARIGRRLTQVPAAQVGGPAAERRDRDGDDRLLRDLDDERRRAARVRVGRFWRARGRRARVEGPLPERHADARLLLALELDELARLAVVLAPHGEGMRAL